MGRPAPVASRCREPHLLLTPLIVVVDAVLRGRLAGVERGPGGAGQILRRAGQSSGTPGSAQGGQVRQGAVGGPALDQLGIRRIQPDQQHASRALSHEGVSRRGQGSPNTSTFFSNGTPTTEKRDGWPDMTATYWVRSTA